MEKARRVSLTEFTFILQFQIHKKTTDGYVTEILDQTIWKMQNKPLPRDEEDIRMENIRTLQKLSISSQNMPTARDCTGFS